jgi:uncharacterized protein
MLVKPIIRPKSVGCNIRCQYCYHRDKDRVPSKTMAVETAIKIIEEISLLQKEIEITWHGGEPLLASQNFYKKVFDYTRRLNSEGFSITHSIQTNGINLSRDWIDLFSEYDVAIGISLDGPQHIHDSYRVDTSGKGTFSRVMKGIELLKQNNISFGVVVAVTDKNVCCPDSLWEFFLKHEIFSFTLNPCIEINRDCNLRETYSVEATEFANFVNRLFDLWILKDDPRIHIAFLGDILQGFFSSKCQACVLSGDCKNFLVFEHDGTVYPCEDFYGKKYYMGNVLEKSLKQIIEDKYSQDIFAKIDFLHNDCKNCQWLSICHGGCPYLRDDFFSKYYLCESNQRIYQHLANAINESILQPQ